MHSSRRRREPFHLQKITWLRGTFTSQQTTPGLLSLVDSATSRRDSILFTGVARRDNSNATCRNLGGLFVRVACISVSVVGVSRVARLEDSANSNTGVEVDNAQTTKSSDLTIAENYSSSLNWIVPIAKLLQFWVESGTA